MVKILKWWEIDIGSSVTCIGYKCSYCGTLNWALRVIPILFLEGGGGYFVMRISVILITSANLSQNEDFFPLSWNFSQCVKLRKQVNE